MGIQKNRAVAAVIGFGFFQITSTSLQKSNIALGKRGEWGPLRAGRPFSGMVWHAQEAVDALSRRRIGVRLLPAKQGKREGETDVEECRCLSAIYDPVSTSKKAAGTTIAKLVSARP